MGALRLDGSLGDHYARLFSDGACALEMSRNVREAALTYLLDTGLCIPMLPE